MGVLIYLIIISLFAQTALASPFLVCNPDKEVETYQGIRNGVPFTTKYSLHPSGAAIIFDLGTVNVGTATQAAQNFTEIRACNENGCSEPVKFKYPDVKILLSGSHSVTIGKGNLTLSW